MALLVVGRRRELHDAHVARVELRDEPLDRAALAARVPALEEHAHRRPDPALADEPAEHEPQREQPHLGRLEARLGLLLGELERQVEVVEASHNPGSYHVTVGTFPMRQVSTS